MNATCLQVKSGDVTFRYGMTNQPGHFSITDGIQLADLPPQLTRYSISGPGAVSQYDGIRLNIVDTRILINSADSILADGINPASGHDIDTAATDDRIGSRCAWCRIVTATTP